MYLSAPFLERLDFVVDCTIDGINHKAEGVARISGKATFVPFALPGETVKVEIIEEKKRYQRARVIQLVDPSSNRTQPACPHYYECGGCALQHADYETQLALKQRIVQENLKKLGDIQAPVHPVIGMDSPWTYRNKVEWHIHRRGKQTQMGYFQTESHKLVEIQSCLLISQEMQEISDQICRHAEEIRLPENGKLTIRQSSLNGEMIVIINGRDAHSVNVIPLQNMAKVTSVYGVENNEAKLLFGKEQLLEKIGSVSYQISPLSFFQVNPKQTEKLFDVVKDYANLSGTEQVLDAYCGTGSISLYLANQCGQVLGIESNAQAVEDARSNALINQVNNADFLTGKCEVILGQLEADFDLAILDPPRAGCEPELIQVIAKKQIERVIYVSCNPATLARDLALFVKLGYEVQEVQPVDMFAQTYHVETVVLMSRVK